MSQAISHVRRVVDHCDRTGNAFASVDAGPLRELLAAYDQAAKAAEAGERFKTFVHAYLDQHGVPHGDETNAHQREGCRIGARLDLLFAQRDEARACKPDEYELIRSCERAAQESRHAAERERDRLVAEVLKLRQQVEGHAERIAAQSEILSRRAEKAVPDATH